MKSTALLGQRRGNGLCVRSDFDELLTARRTGKSALRGTAALPKKVRVSRGPLSHFGCSHSTLSLFLILAVLLTTAHAELPPRPEPRQFFHDLAGVVDDVDKQEILGIQDRVFRQAGVPIVVVSVNRMSDFDATAPNIETFAQRWFDHWGIGSQAKNDGMLVMVSVGDRRARIELGSAWGRRFDERAERIMNGQMVPEFKTADYSAGILAGVESLESMALAGPTAEPGFGERLQQAQDFANHNNPIADRGGPVLVVMMVVAGLGCFVLAYYFPDYRQHFVIMGITLISLAVIFWVTILVLALFSRGRGSAWSGGGFGGGSSGGGGASGGW